MHAVLKIYQMAQGKHGFMSKNMSKNQLRWLWLSWLVLIIDQYSKWFVVRHLIFQQPVQINRFFNLTLDFNTGAAFSFLQRDNGWQMWLFGGIAVFVSIVILIVLMRMPKTHQLRAASLALILAGAVGNLLDRIMLGHVVDFISWHINNYYWPTFNIADSAVCVGAVLLIIGSYYDDDKRQQ